MYPSGRFVCLAVLFAFAGCATDEGPYRWRQFKGSVGFESAENYCKSQDQIYRSNLTMSVFDTLMLATAPPAGAVGYSKGMAERQQGQTGMDMESCMKSKGWNKVPM